MSYAAADVAIDCYQVVDKEADGSGTSLLIKARVALLRFSRSLTY